MGLTILHLEPTSETSLLEGEVLLACTDTRDYGLATTQARGLFGKFVFLRS